MGFSEPMRNRSLSAIGAVGANVQSVDRASNETFTDLRQVLLRWQDVRNYTLPAASATCVPRKYRCPAAAFVGIPPAPDGRSSPE
jgi:hypothetical protein